MAEPVTKLKTMRLFTSEKPGSGKGIYFITLFLVAASILIKLR